VRRIGRILPAVAAGAACIVAIVVATASGQENAKPFGLTVGLQQDLDSANRRSA
jgi:hypothetical protein